MYILKFVEVKKIMVSLVFATLILVSCNTEAGGKDTKNNENVGVKNNNLTGSVLEVVDVDKYTYIKIKNSNNKEVWVAGPKESVKVGDKVSIKPGMLMKDFVSKTLNRTFSEIYFVGSLTGKSKSSFHGGNYKMSSGEKYHKKSDAQNQRLKAEIEKKYEIKKIDKAEGGYSIEEIYQQKNDLNGKKIKVKGMVVKFSPEIMNRNWIHLRDGSGETENNDLTVTTDQKVKTGDIVTFEGVLAVDKDFGYGYKYNVIIEKSEIK
jgi:frataxin-like iron-binding protein CyaY